MTVSQSSEGTGRRPATGPPALAQPATGRYVSALCERAGMSLERGLRRGGYTSSFSNSRAMRQRPSAPRRQTMRKRLRTRGASEPFGPVTQFPRPCVAAKSPAPMVESATISIEEMTTAGARSEARPVPRPPAFRVRRRSHPPCSSQPRPSGLKPRTLRREPSPRFESRRRRTKRASLGGHYSRRRRRTRRGRVFERRAGQLRERPLA